MADEKRDGNIFKRLLRWFFGSPASEIPQDFGNPVDADLQVFEERQDDIVHDAHEQPAPRPEKPSEPEVKP